MGSTSEKPELVHRLMRFTTDYLIKGSQMWLDTFQDARNLLLVSEPIASNNIISPYHFKEFAFPYIKEFNEAVLKMGYKHIFFHICGDQNENLKFWKEIPMGDPGIISIGHEFDIETVAEVFPNDIIHGNLEPIVLQTMKPEDVYKAVKKIVEQGKRTGGRFAFGQGCEIPPMTPKGNLRAMAQAVYDNGWYDR